MALLTLLLTLLLKLAALAALTLVFMTLFQYGPENLPDNVEKEIAWISGSNAAGTAADPDPKETETASPENDVPLPQ